MLPRVLQIMEWLLNTWIRAENIETEKAPYFSCFQKDVQYKAVTRTKYEAGLCEVRWHCKRDGVEEDAWCFCFKL